MHYGEIERSITSMLEGAALAVLSELDIQPPLSQDIRVELEIPKEKSHGDISSNIALKTSRLASKPPVEFAELLKARLDISIQESPVKDAIERLEVKKPGFINFFVSRKCLHGVLSEIKRLGEDFGKSDSGGGAKLQIEFVSANPTGPLTIAHGRQAALGDSLANIMKFLGYDVTREYYLNDEGNQMNILGRSIRARYMNICGIDEPFPEDGYKGSYVIDIAKEFEVKHGRGYVGTQEIDAFREFGLQWILSDIKKDLDEFGVKFDVWYSQKLLGQSGKVEKAVDVLKGKGYIYESEGAVWFKSTQFGDDKDRVIYKSDGAMTYLTPDIAYHLDKFNRGFTRIIDIWGPDHHGYIPRMKSAIQALGYPGDALSVLIVQLATLYRGGQVVSMSTRSGEFVTLREVMDEVGKDVARFCFIMRRMSSHLDFDLDVVKKESSENPVYYIQYAHARIWSILENSKDAGISDEFDPTLLKEPEEIEMMRSLRQFPMAVALSGRILEPYVILQYLQDLASAFHHFYNKHRVLGPEARLAKSRVVLIDCVRIVLANGLRLLGVSLPKKM